VAACLSLSLSVSVCVCINVCGLYYLQVYVQPVQCYAVLLKLSVWPPVSAVPLPEPRGESVQLSLGCSSHDEAPSCSTQTDKQTDRQTHR